MSTRDLRNIVEALPQYNEQYDKLSLHVDVSLHYTQKYCSNFKNTLYFDNRILFSL